MLKNLMTNNCNQPGVATIRVIGGACLTGHGIRRRSEALARQVRHRRNAMARQVCLRRATARQAGRQDAALHGRRDARRYEYAAMCCLNAGFGWLESPGKSARGLAQSKACGAGLGARRDERRYEGWRNHTL